MATNIKCPKCGSNRVQLSNVENKHGCLFTILFGIYYIMLVFCKWCVAAMLLIFVDWWMAIIKAIQHKGYVWKFKGWISNKKKTYYCHDCGHNFKA